MPSADDLEAPAALLLEVLGDARTAGFLGPGPLETQVAHAAGFVAVGRDLSQQQGSARPRVADLGSGGGLPGLVVAQQWPEVELMLVEANGRRATFLRRAVHHLGLAGRVEVVQARAESCGRDPGLRAGFDGVVARSFGRPAVVAECAAPLLRVGGWLVVSEPPSDARDSDGPVRWPPGPLAELGLEPIGTFDAGFEYQMLRQGRPCPDRFPRRDGVPAKRPLF